MVLVPGQTVLELAPELHAKAVGESMDSMHELDVRPIVESFRRAGVPDKRFLDPFVHQKAFNFFEEKTPWAADLVAWLRDHLPLDGENLAVIHVDYHGGNLMFENGSISGVLDWLFCISDPAVDLAHTINDYLVLIPQIDIGDVISFMGADHGWGSSGLSSGPLNHEHIKACRVFHLFWALTAGLAGGGIGFMRKPESQRDYLSFIEQATGIRLSPTA